MDHDHDQRMDGARGNGKMRIVFFVMLAIAAFFLLTEHRAHALGILPYLLLLACPLMHLFGHHGHGHEHRQGSDAGENKGPASSRPES